MASPMRSSGTHERTRNDNNQPESVNHQQPALAVAPLNSMPYIGPPTSQSSTAPLPTQGETEAAENIGPAMIFLPSNSDREEWDNLVAHTKSGFALTGSAAMGKIGPSVGRVNIAETEDSYHFRVSLPGVSRDEKDFSCDIEPDGSILIKGVTTTGEKTVCKYSQVFKMLTQNLCPPGHFSISFQLPGPVDHQQFQGHFGTDGILEGLVKKR